MKFIFKDSIESRMSRSSSKRNDDVVPGGNAVSRTKRSNNGVIKYKDSDPENSDDETDEESDAKKGSRKFFRATEKERVRKYLKITNKIFWFVCEKLNGK